jgi:hypothetical protein
VPQEHLPAEVAGEQFYRPGRHGAEPALHDELLQRRGEHVTDKDRSDDVDG